MQGRFAACVGPALPALFLCLSAGCGGCGRDPDSYPDHVLFEPRSDAIVVKLPTVEPTGPDPVGEPDDLPRLNRNGGSALDPAAVSEEHRAELNHFLRTSFGTPAAPTIVLSEDAAPYLDALGLSNERLAEGNRLYRRHCQECHGLSGDGRGPSGVWGNPRPRDYRQGSFKFVSTGPSKRRKPTRDDLHRTLVNGLPGTPMPSFALRTENERERLIDYVIFLSIRGRTEFETLQTLLVQGTDGLESSVTNEALAVAVKEAAAWSKADSQVLPGFQPPELPDPERRESVRRGHDLFMDPKGAACATCHVDYGRQGKWQFDNFGRAVRPADLTEQRRKGGSLAADHYRRFRGGIDPVNMPAAVLLTEAQAWDVVRFLQALPFRDHLPEDLKRRIHPD